jgi:hypothetical protein
MVGIAERVCRKMQQLWLSKREKHIVVPPELMEQIGREALQLNSATNGEQGGRGVKRLVGDLIESRIQSAAAAAPEAYKACPTIRLVYRALNPELARQQSRSEDDSPAGTTAPASDLAVVFE